MDDTILINMEEVYEITGGSEELFRQMMELFIEISPAQLDRINESWSKGDYRELSASAHDMKSSASSFGARVLYEAALKVEQSAKMELELNDILPMIKDMRDKTEKTISYYKTCSWPAGDSGTV